MMQHGGILGGYEQLVFTNETTWPFQLHGREEAGRALAYGPGYGFRNLTDPSKRSDEAVANGSIIEKISAILGSVFI